MKIRLPLWLAFGTALALGCSSSSGSSNDPPSCGQACAVAGGTNTTNANSTGGTSTKPTGGAPATGGAMAAASGGTSVATGGAVAATTGGSIAVASGGTTTTTGGTLVDATGGATNPSTGGKAANGGAASPGTGGKAATGGASAANTGGSISTGGSAAVGAGGASTTPTRCSTVSGTVAKALVDAGAILLDVRTASEFAANGLAGAINIPLADLPTRMTELDKSKNIVVYCASGNRSGQANTQLCDAGFNVFNLGAITNWPQ